MTLARVYCGLVPVAGGGAESVETSLYSPGVPLPTTTASNRFPGGSTRLSTGAAGPLNSGFPSSATTTNWWPVSCR